MLKETEWDFLSMEKGEHDCDNCGYVGLKNLFYIQHCKTGEIKIVGSECVKMFMNLNAEAFVKVLNEDDLSSTFPQTVLNHAEKRKLINEWEKGFITNMYNRRRPLSEKQKNCKIKINTKIKNSLVKKKRRLLSRIIRFYIECSSSSFTKLLNA
jgi:hypothetical protein